MGIDHLVQLDCAPRRAFAGADLTKGSQRIMDMIKANDRAAMIATMAKQQGLPLETMKIRSVKLLPTGPVEVDLTHADMVREAQPAAAQAGHCKGCPANVLGSAYGCYDSVSYPIAPAVEEWLMDRLQAPDTVGGQFLHRALADFRYDGSTVRSYRERKLFAAPVAASRKWKTGFFSSKSVTVDQIWHALLTVGPISPSHGSMVLLWLGALQIDGRVPMQPNPDAQLVQAMLRASREERMQRTRLDLGPKPTEPQIAALQSFFRALYTAWLNDVELVVDA